MTRINLVSPSSLSGKHLMAEYRELPRIFTAVLKLQHVGLKPSDVSMPKKYKLGAGHNKFFYNKCGWLKNRYSDLCAELLVRKYDLNLDMFNDIMDTADTIADEWCGTFEPDPEDFYLNFARLAKRSGMDRVISELQS